MLSERSRLSITPLFSMCIYATSSTYPSGTTALCPKVHEIGKLLVAKSLVPTNHPRAARRPTQPQPVLRHSRRRETMSKGFGRVQRAIVHALELAPPQALPWGQAPTYT